MGNHRAEHVGTHRPDSAQGTAYVGRRVANRATETASTTPATPYVGKRMARPVVEDTLQSSPVVDQANLEAEVTGWTAGRTLFAADVREHTGALPFALTDAFTGSLPRIEPLPGTDFSADTTANLPVVPAGGKRRAAKRAASRGPLFKGVPSLPVLVGVAALAISAAGAVTSGDASLSQAASGQLRPASAMSGTSAVAAVGVVRDTAVSRSGSRADAESTAKEREASLAKLGQQAAGHAEVLKANQWKLPVDPADYRITATFGQYGLWARAHTGLDFAAPTGSPIFAVANGTITSTGYDGAYGNKTVLTLDDGTEIWFCHQSAVDVSVGATVHAGELIGRVGSTGNTTGPHLHLEVRPGGGDPVNPYTALTEQGLNP